MLENLKKLEKYINSELSSKIHNSVINNDELLIEVGENDLTEVVQFIKDTSEKQKDLAKKGQLGEALRIGGLIQGASQIYRNLCR